MVIDGLVRLSARLKSRPFLQNIVESLTEGIFSQGLKPTFLLGVFGTTEVVP